MTESTQQMGASGDPLTAISGPERQATFASISEATKALDAHVQHVLGLIEQQKRHDQAALDRADARTTAMAEFVSEIDVSDLEALEDLFNEIASNVGQVSALLNPAS